MDDVVLGNIGELLAETVVVAIEIDTVEEDLAGSGARIAVEGLEEGGVTGASGAHHGDELGGVGDEGDRLSEGTAIGSEDGDVLRFDADVASVVAACKVAIGENLETYAADTDFLAGADLRFRGNANAVEEGAVERAEILDEGAGGSPREARVMPGDGGMRDGLFAGGIAADGHGMSLEEDGGESGFAEDGFAFLEDPGGRDFIGAEENVVGGMERRALDAIMDAIKGGAVAGVEIFDEVGAVMFGDASVMGGDHGVVEADVAIGSAADVDGARSRSGGSGRFDIGRPRHGNVVGEKHVLERGDFKRGVRGQEAIFDVGAIAGAEVLEQEASVGFGEAAVLAGDGGLGEAEIAGGRGADEPGSNRLRGLTGQDALRGGEECSTREEARK